MFNPEGPSSKKEMASPRPTSEDIDDAVMNQKMNRKMSPMAYESTKNQFIGWSEGESDETRTEYYPGWADQDFSQLLERLEKMEASK